MPSSFSLCSSDSVQEVPSLGISLDSMLDYRPLLTDVQEQSGSSHNANASLHSELSSKPIDEGFRSDEFVGRPVQKDFGKHGCFQGTIRNSRKYPELENPIYLIVYDNGYEEDVFFDEVRQLVSRPCRTQRKALTKGRRTRVNEQAPNHAKRTDQQRKLAVKLPKKQKAKDQFVIPRKKKAKCTPSNLPATETAASQMDTPFLWDAAMMAVPSRMASIDPQSDADTSDDDFPLARLKPESSSASRSRRRRTSDPKTRVREDWKTSYASSSETYSSSDISSDDEPLSALRKPRSRGEVSGMQKPRSGALSGRDPPRRRKASCGQSD